MTAMQRVLGSASVFVAVLSLASPAAWSQVAGEVTEVEGTAEVNRGGASGWTALAVSDPVSVGDRLRTGVASKLRVTYRDDSALTLDEESEMAVDQQAIPASGPSTSLFSLNRGKVDAEVTTDRYKTPGSRFDVRTATAVAGVRGTEFFGIYDPGKRNTRVCSTRDVTRVESLEVAGEPTLLDPGYCVDCPANRPCTPPFALGGGQGGVSNTTIGIGLGTAAAVGGGLGIAAALGAFDSNQGPATTAK